MPSSDTPGFFTRLFKGVPAPEPAKIETPPYGEVAYGESAIYGKQFRKYNPSELVGRRGWRVYHEMMRDEQIKAVVMFKRDAVTSRDWHILPPKEMTGDQATEADKAEGEARVALMYQMLGQLKGSLTDRLNSIMSAMWTGVSFNEKIYKAFECDGKTWYGIGDIKIRPWQTFWFEVDEFSNVIDLVQRVGMRREKIDPERLIIYINRPDVDPHYGESELLACYRAWYSKDTLIKLYNIHLERHASPLLWMQPKPNSGTIQPGSVEYNNLVTAMSNLNAKSWLMLPSKIDLNVIKPEANVAYPEAIAMHDKAIAKALLVPNLLGISEQGQHGALAQSQTQFRAFLMTLDADANRLEEAINEQLIRHLGDFNWGDDQYPEFRFKPADTETILNMLTVWSNLVRFGAAQHSDSDEEHLREILDFPAKDAGSATAPNQPRTPKTLLPTEPQDPNNPDVHPQNDPNQPTDPNRPPDQGAPDPTKPLGETVAGRDVVTVAAHNRETFSKALKRVDFAVLDRATAEMADRQAKLMLTSVRALEQELLDRVPDLLASPSSTVQLTPGRNDVSRLRQAVRGMLADGWELGTRHAAKEIQQARGKRFAANEPTPMTDAEAAAFFDAKSFTIAGNLADDIVAEMQQLLFNGIKNSTPAGDVVKQMKQALDAMGVSDVSDARLQTIARTNMFEAINEARFSFFRDPAIGDFVQALEFSAIMDSRTTEVCAHLNGKVYAADAPEWSTYRPPLHFNCRSILVAVTTADGEWHASPPPTVDPQKGFG